jgi:signal transduction histidine kinase
MVQFPRLKRTCRTNCLLLLATLITGSSYLRAQDSSSIPCIDISKIGYGQRISSQAWSGFISHTDSLATNFSQLAFKKGMVHKTTVPPIDVTRKAILRFSICNTSDTASSIWFFPGFFYQSIKLYKQEKENLVAIPVIIPEIKDNHGYRLITLPAHDSATIFAELKLVRTHINSMRPRLIHADRIDAFIKDIQADHRTNNMVTFVFSGLLLMMILFSMANYVQGANKEFLYYAGYAFFVGGMLFTKAFFDMRPNYIGYFLEGYLDFIMQSLGIMFYMIFMQRFLETREKHPFLFKLYNLGIFLLVISMILFTWFHYFTNSFSGEFMVENITKFILLGLTIIFLVYSLRQWNDRLLRYVFWGNLCLLIFSLLSLLLSLISRFMILPGIWSSALLYYEIGLFLELVFFFAGLNFKNRQLIIAQTKERERLRTENQMKEYEKELAVYKAQQEERQRISADMHDELGAGMTAIRLMSEIARNKMKENTPVEIEKISHSADEVLNKMNAIIWSMNSGNDTLDNLISYIRSYAIEYLENTSIHCKVTTPPDIDDREITGDKRRNIFLCVKETLNNALKHSGASELRIDVNINHSLVIRIADNGIGIDKQNIRQFGNGLKNINRRMENIGGSYEINNHQGTVTTLTLPL